LARAPGIGTMNYHVSVPLHEFEKRFDAVVRAGFDPEVRMTDVEHMRGVTPAEIARIGKLIAERGRRTFTHGPFLGLDAASLNEHIARYSAECLERGCEVTAGVGGSVMVIHSNYSPFYSRVGFRAWLANWSERMPAILATARGLGVTVALANTWEERPEVLAHLVDIVSGGGLAVCLDTGHINAFSRLPVRRWWRSLSDRVIALHLHDNDGFSDDHEAPGRGTFDFPALVECIRGIDPAPLATFEVELAGAIEGRGYLEGLPAVRG